MIAHVQPAVQVAQLELLHPRQPGGWNERVVDEIRAVAVPVPVEARSRLGTMGLASSRVIDARVPGLGEEVDRARECRVARRITAGVVVEVADGERPTSSEERTVVVERPMRTPEPWPTLSFGIRRPHGVAFGPDLTTGAWASNGSTISVRMSPR